MDQTVQITCPKCRARFREQARKLIDGFSRECPTCETVIFFNEGSTTLQIKSAMNIASAVRRALRAEAGKQTFKSARTFSMSRHSQLADSSDENN